MIVAVVEDLLFGSRIRAAAEAAASPVTFVRPGGDLAATLDPATARLVLVDLGAAGAADAIRAVRARLGSAVPIVAFVSHMRADLIAEARTAGATRVLARSAFVTELGALVATAAAAS